MMEEINISMRMYDYCIDRMTKIHMTMLSQVLKIDSINLTLSCTLLCRICYKKLQLFAARFTQREKCPNKEFFLVRIWTLFTQCYKHDFNAFSVQAQWTFHPKFLRGSNCLSFPKFINSFRASPASKQPILAEAYKLIKLILVSPPTNAISEQSFSTLKRLKTKMRFTILV